jgi:hypothetical protein
MGRVGGTTALLDEIPRSLVQAGNSGTPLLPLVEYPDRGSTRSHGVGHPALSAKRLAAGWMAGTMALLASGEPSTRRQRAVNHDRAPVRWLIPAEHWSETLANWESHSVSHAQEATTLAHLVAVMRWTLPTARQRGFFGGVPGMAALSTLCCWGAMSWCFDWSLMWGGVSWFSAFDPSVLRSYPFCKFHPTPSTNITSRVKAHRGEPGSLPRQRRDKVWTPQRSEGGPRRRPGAGVGIYKYKTKISFSS